MEALELLKTDAGGTMATRKPVLFTSIPKCGTHLLLNYFDRAGFRHAGPFGKVLWEDAFIECVRGLGDAEYSAWHFRWTSGLSDIVRDRDIRVVFLYRDPRAHLVSKLHFVMTMPIHAWHPYIARHHRTDRERFLRMIEGIPWEDVRRFLPGFEYRDPVSPKVPEWRLPAGINWVYGTFAGWLDDPQCLPVKFEDIVGARGGGDRERQLAVIGRILEFTVVENGSVDVEEIADGLYDENSTTFRRGRIDSWRDEFTGEIHECFMRHAAGLLDLFGYEA